MQLTVLASGSAGNASVLFIDGQVVLIDAGLSPRRVHRACTDMGLPRPSHILLTHPDSDHLYKTWSTFVNRGEVLLHLHKGHVPSALAAGFKTTFMRPFDNACAVGPMHMELTLASHDQQGTCVFLLHIGDTRLGWATDIGRITPTILKLLRRSDVLAIESNYDRDMQEQSDRPWFLKQRIMGGSGHLSNSETLHAVKAIAKWSDLRHIVLLHLSRQCNCPMRIEDLWLSEAPHLADRLMLSSQHQPLHVGLLGTSLSSSAS
jgi:phosphoribosyl 1,2-cyclic phosphodiesterase